MNEERRKERIMSEERQIIRVEDFTFYCDPGLEVTPKIRRDIDDFIQDLRTNPEAHEEDLDYKAFTLFHSGEDTVIY